MMSDGGDQHDESKANDLEDFEEWEGGEGGVPEGAAAGSDPGGDLPPAEGLAAEPAPSSAPADEPPLTAAQSFADSLLELAPDVPVNLVAVIGKTTWNVGELIKLRLGQVIELGRAPGETVDVVANGRLIARGELVDVDGQLGVRILKMVR